MSTGLNVVPRKTDPGERPFVIYGDHLRSLENALSRAKAVCSEYAQTFVLVFFGGRLICVHDHESHDELFKRYISR